MEADRMEKPLLDPPSDEQSGGLWACMGAVWRWLRGAGKRETTHAETIQALKTFMDSLTLSMNSLEHNYTKKRHEAAALAREAGDRANARRVLQTANQYKQKYDALFAMRENVERLKADLIFQKQQHAMFSTFSRANQAMETMLKDMHVDKVMATLDRIQENLETGREISDILATPIESGTAYDEDELDRELDEMVAEERIGVLMETNVPVAAEKSASKKKAVMV